MSDANTTLGLSLGNRRSGGTSRSVAPLPMPTRRRGAITLAQIQAKYAEDQKRNEKPKGMFSGGLGGIISGVGDAITGLPNGILHLAGTAADTIIGIPRLGYDVVTGNADKYDTYGKVLHEYLPLVSELQSSMGRTLLDVRHPTRIARAYNDGTLVNKVLEDAGNVAIVGSIAAKGLTVAGEAAAAGGAEATAARFAQAAKVTERVAHLGGQVANAPMTGVGELSDSLLRAGGKKVAGWAEKGFGKMMESDGALGDIAHKMQNHLAMQLTPEGKIAWDATREGWRKGNRVHSSTWQVLHDLADETGASLDEQGAALSLLNGVAELDQFAGEVAARKGLNFTSEDVRRLHVLTDRPEQSFSAGVQQVARAYREGTLDQAARARVERVMEGVKPILKRSETSALAGEGRHALNPTQLLNEPMDPYIIDTLRKVTDPATGMPLYDNETLNTLMSFRNDGMSWTDIEAQLGDALPGLTEALNDPMNWPSRWRPMMVAAKQANVAGDASLGTTFGLDLPVRPTDMLAAGLNEPTYLPGGESPLVNPKNVKMPRQPVNLGMRGYQAVGADAARIASETQPYSLRVLADLTSSTLRTVEFNKALLKFVQNPGVLNVQKMLGDEVLTGIEDNARRYAEAHVNRSIQGEPVLGPAPVDNPGFNFPNAVKDAHPTSAKMALRETGEYRKAYGKAVVDALAERGYEILAGNPRDPVAGDFDPATAIALDRVNGDAIVLPIGVKRRLIQNMTSKPNAVLEALGWTNSKFKGAVLPFSIRWHLGDLVGGAFMAWEGAGIPPWELVRAMREIRNLSPEAASAIIDHPDFVRQGLNFEQSRWRSDGPDAKQPRTIIGRTQQRSFKFNETINRVNREGFLLAKVQRLLDDMGLDIKSADRNALWDHPDVQDAITQAVDSANKTMGTFDELTPFESRYLKNVFPFYVWARHITALAFRTAIDNPARMVWTLRLGAYGMDTQDLPDWLKGSIGIPDALVPDFIAKGDVLMPTQFINPFNDVLNTPAFTPQGITRSLAPAIKIGLLGGVLGQEPGDSFNQPLRSITRPYGEKRNPFRDMLSLGLNTFPVTREAINLAPTFSIGGLGFGPHTRYHSGRNMVDANGNPIPTNKTRGQVPLGLFGLPIPTSASQAQSIQASAQKAATVKRRKKRKVVLG